MGHNPTTTFIIHVFHRQKSRLLVTLDKKTNKLKLTECIDSERTKRNQRSFESQTSDNNLRILTYDWNKELR